jgi:hypothetical protein
VLPTAQFLTYLHIYAQGKTDSRSPLSNMAERCGRRCKQPALDGACLPHHFRRSVWPDTVWVETRNEPFCFGLLIAIAAGSPTGGWRRPGLCRLIPDASAFASWRAYWIAVKPDDIARFSARNPRQARMGMVRNGFEAGELAVIVRGSELDRILHCTGRKSRPHRLDGTAWRGRSSSTGYYYSIQKRRTLRSSAPARSLGPQPATPRRAHSWHPRVGIRDLGRLSWPEAFERGP